MTTTTVARSESQNTRSTFSNVVRAVLSFLLRIAIHNRHAAFTGIIPLRVDRILLISPKMADMGVRSISDRLQRIFWAQMALGVICLP